MADPRPQSRNGEADYQAMFEDRERYRLELLSTNRFPANWPEMSAAYMRAWKDGQKRLLTADDKSSSPAMLFNEWLDSEFYGIALTDAQIKGLQAAFTAGMSASGVAEANNGRQGAVLDGSFGLRCDQPIARQLSEAQLAEAITWARTNAGAFAKFPVPEKTPQDSYLWMLSLAVVMLADRQAPPSESNAQAELNAIHHALLNPMEAVYDPKEPWVVRTAKEFILKAVAAAPSETADSNVRSWNNAIKAAVDILRQNANACTRGGPAEQQNWPFVLETMAREIGKMKRQEAA